MRFARTFDAIAFHRTPAINEELVEVSKMMRRILVWLPQRKTMRDGERNGETI